MNSGLYSALSGSVAAMKRMDVISNNLANANTPGFKKDAMLFETVLTGADNSLAASQGTSSAPTLQNNNTFIDYSTGSIAQTGNVLDMAIDGDGFFVVETPDGLVYTRQGNFHITSNGTLVTSNGFPVMNDQNAPITIEGSLVEVESTGLVKVDGEEVGSLQIVDFPKPYRLTKVSSASFIPEDARVEPQPATGGVSQGHLENSNVEAISEMVQMIATHRYYEACQKVVRSFDDMVGKAVNDLGKL